MTTAETTASPHQPYGVARLDAARCITDCNARFEAILEGAAAVLRGLSLDDLISARDRKRQQDYLASVAALTIGGTKHLLAKLTTQCGGESLVEMRLQRLDAHWIVGICVVDDQHVLQELLLSHARWRAVLRSSSVGIAVLDGEGRLVEFNLALLDALGIQNGTRCAAQCGSRSRPVPVGARGPRWIRAGAHCAQSEIAKQRRFQGIVHCDDRVLVASLTPLALPNSDAAGTCLVVKDKTAEEHAARLREDLARAAGMAEVATGVLHNVGNTLNGANVTAGLIEEKLRTSRLSKLEQAVSLLRTHVEANACFAQDDHGQQVVTYLGSLAQQLEQERLAVTQELGRLREGIEHIKIVVASQQQFAQSTAVTERCEVSNLLQSAMILAGGSYAEQDIDVESSGLDRAVRINRHAVLQILVNLLTNAQQALQDNVGDKKLRVVASTDDNGSWSISVTDNGIGIPAENLDKIFMHGFTTKQNGHGSGCTMQRTRPSLSAAA